MSTEGPMLPWDVAMQQVEDNSNLTGEGDAWLFTSREAAAQDMLLGPGGVLQVAADPVSEVKREGVAVVADVLSRQSVQDMCNYVAQELSKSKAAVEADPCTKYLHFSRHIRQTRATNLTPQSRWELLLPHCHLTAKVLVELLQGPMGSALAELAGPDAELWEFTSLIAGPGAVAQELHCDVSSFHPALFTAFVALQDVDRDMGPTRFVPETHMNSAHRRFSADKSGFLNTVTSSLALLKAGDAVLYDSRVLHCGTGNISKKPRYLLVVTLRHQHDTVVKVETRKTQRAFVDRVTLADFRPQTEKRRLYLQSLY